MFLYHDAQVAPASCDQLSGHWMTVIPLSLTPSIRWVENDPLFNLSVFREEIVAFLLRNMQGTMWIPPSQYLSPTELDNLLRYCNSCRQLRMAF